MEKNDILRKIMSKEKEIDFYVEMKLFAEKKIYENKVSISVLEDLRHELISEDVERLKKESGYE